MNNLNKLRINQEGILPSFDKDIYDYYLTINEDIDSLEIEAIPENSNSKIEIVGNENLNEGENTIFIKVISDSEETVYTIQVVKTQNIELYNCNLEVLEIENVLFEPAFDSNITDYKLEVSNEISSLNVFAVPENENSIVEISGSNKLDVGNNLIEIIVSSQNQKMKKKYSLHVYRKTRKESNEYEEIQKENNEKVQELLSEGSNEYNVEKTKLILTQYKSNNNVIEIGILFSILFVLLIIVALFKSKKN